MRTCEGGTGHDGVMGVSGGGGTSWTTRVGDVSTAVSGTDRQQALQALRKVLMILWYRAVAAVCCLLCCLLYCFSIGLQRA